MREVNGELIEDGDKYYELVPLYNAWRRTTIFLSTNLCVGSKYDELLDYCKNNKIETLHFFLDLIDCYAESAKSGTRADDCVGHFLKVLEAIFPDMIKYDGYVGFKQAQKMWKVVAVTLLDNLKK